MSSLAESLVTRFFRKSLNLMRMKLNFVHVYHVIEANYPLAGISVIILHPKESQVFIFKIEFHVMEEDES